MGPHDDEDVLELRPDVGDEGESTGLLRVFTVLNCCNVFGSVPAVFQPRSRITYLKDNRHDIVADVAFSGKLLPASHSTVKGFRLQTRTE